MGKSSRPILRTDDARCHPPDLQGHPGQCMVFLGIWNQRAVGYKIAVIQPLTNQKAVRSEIPMIRHFTTCSVVIAILLLLGAARVEAEPTIYELMINGESFLVEGNRAKKLESKQKPGIVYNVALRIAPTQRHKMGHVQFEYDWLCKVADVRKTPRHSVRLRHELGVSMLITELGGALQPKVRDEVLKIQVDSVAEGLAELKVKNLKIGKPFSNKSKNNSRLGVVISYNDEEGVAHTCIVCVLVGPDFTVSSVIEYLDDNSKDVIPLVKKTLDSLSSIR
jgi:hypothetical protein